MFFCCDEHRSLRTAGSEEAARDLLTDENDFGITDLIKTWWDKALDYNV